jgi:UDP-N-acetylmuramate dehydrogenase
MASFSIESEVALDRLNTLGLSARAERYCKISSVEALQALFLSEAWGDGPSLVLGGGSNIVLSGDIAGLTIHVAVPGLVIEPGQLGTRVVAGAGVDWHALVCETLAVGEGGLENLIAIPGSAGGAPVQNIGAYGLELDERIRSVSALDTHSGEIVVMDSTDCEFDYRDSIFKRHPGRFIIVTVELLLPRPWQPVLSYAGLNHLPEDSKNALGIANAVAALRRAKLPDPKVIGNAGSFFKNPLISHDHFAQLLEAFPGIVGYPQANGEVKLAAGWLIEDAGYKGLSRGAAAVHEHQALVLVNRGGATAKEMLELADAVRAGVHQRFGVLLEQEPVLI